MKQTTILNMSVLLVLAAAANAQEPDEGKTCTNETLKGSYGSPTSGTRPAPSVFLGDPAFKVLGTFSSGLDLTWTPIQFASTLSQERTAKIIGSSKSTTERFFAIIE
jgi:hypothetical protein